jgi:hypothetical protein
MTITATLPDRGGAHANIRDREVAETERIRVAIAGTRWRKKNDLLLLKKIPPQPWAALADRLVEDGFLKGWDCDNAERVCEAVAKFLRAYSS